MHERCTRVRDGHPCHRPVDAWDEECPLVHDLDATPTDAGLQATPGAFITLIYGLDTRERELVFAAIRGTFCLHCGTADPRCHCNNDD